MKRKYILIPLLSGAVAMTACKDKSSTTAPDAAGSTAQADVAKPDPIKATATPETRAEKLGFAQKLPKDIAYFGALYNGRKAFDQFMKSPLGILVLERLADEGMSMDDMLDNEDVLGQIAAYSEEYFTAYGKGSGQTLDLALNFYERLFYYGGRSGVFVGDQMVKTDGAFSPDSPKVLTEGPLKGAPKEIIQMLAEFDVPSYYQGSKISDEEARKSLAAQMQQSFGFAEMMFDDAVEKITIKRGGAEFKGFKLNGKVLAAKITDKEIAEMQEIFEVEDIKAFKETLATKTLVAVSGEIDGYVVTFIGKTEADFVLVDKAADSVCSNEKLTFIDQYIGKDILFAGYSDSEMTKSSTSVGALCYRMVGSLAKGLKDGLGDASSLGDTQDIEVLLESLQEQGSQLASLFTVTDAGYVGYIEDGLKFEMYGGSNIPSLDLSKTNTLSPLEQGEGTVLFANWTQDKDYNEKVMEYVETLSETGYMVTKRVAALDIDDRDFKQFKQGVNLFDQSFRADVLGVWQALRSDLSAGLGAESAVIVDVNGIFPKVPGVPDPILTQGKLPRISYVSTVADRSKLQASWKNINTSSENILKTVNKMMGSDFPMQVPMSSEKNDLKTWFIPIPIQNDDFVPSISVNDQLFFASTSKTFSEGLSEQFKQGGGEARKGAWLRVDFKVLNQYATQWLDLVDKNADKLLPSKSAREDFKANKPMVEDAIKALGSLDDMTMHTRNEGGRSRISFHLKVK